MRGADGFNVQGCRLTTSPVLKSWRQAAPEHIRQSQEEHGGEHVSTTFAFFPIRDGDSYTFATVYGAALAGISLRRGLHRTRRRSCCIPSPLAFPYVRGWLVAVLLLPTRDLTSTAFECLTNAHNYS